MLTLKAAGFKSVQEVGRGMFAWREAGLPTEDSSLLAAMPDAQDDAEEALLKKLGYGKDGKPC